MYHEIQTNTSLMAVARQTIEDFCPQHEDVVKVGINRKSKVTVFVKGNGTTLQTVVAALEAAGLLD